MRTQRMANWMVDAEDAGLSQEQIDKLEECHERILDLVFDGMAENFEWMLEIVGLPSTDETDCELSKEYLELSNAVEYVVYLEKLLKLFISSKK